MGNNNSTSLHNSFSADNSSRKFQYSLMELGQSLCDYDQPSKMYLDKVWNWGSESVDNLICSRRRSLTCMFSCTKCTWALREPRHLWGKYFLESVSATGIRYPGTWTSLKLYLCYCRIMRCNRAGALSINFCIIDTNGLWSVCMHTSRRYM